MEILGVLPHYRAPQIPTQAVYCRNSAEPSATVRAGAETEFWLAQAAEQHRRQAKFDLGVKRRIRAIEKGKRQTNRKVAESTHSKCDRVFHTTLHGSINDDTPPVTRGKAGELVKSIRKVAAAAPLDESGAGPDCSDPSTQHRATKQTRRAGNASFESCVDGVHLVSQLARNRLLSRSGKNVPDNGHASPEISFSLDEFRRESELAPAQPILGPATGRAVGAAAYGTAGGDTDPTGGGGHAGGRTTDKAAADNHDNGSDYAPSSEGILDENDARHADLCLRVRDHEWREQERRDDKAALALRRRLYATVQREQARKRAQTLTHVKKIGSLKENKEGSRRAVEQRYRNEQQLEAAGFQKPSGFGDDESEVGSVELAEAVAVLQAEVDEEMRMLATERRQQQRELDRYAKALRVQLQEKCEKNRIDVSTMNCCEPMALYGRCANNCAFYRDKKAYVKLLTKTMPTFDLPH